MKVKRWSFRVDEDTTQQSYPVDCLDLPYHYRCLDNEELSFWSNKVNWRLQSRQVEAEKDCSNTERQVIDITN